MMTSNLVPRLLLLHAVAIFFLFVQPTGSVADPTATPTVESSFRIFHVASRVTSISVNWTSSNATYDNYQVYGRSLDSGIILVGQPTNGTEFTLTDLRVDAPYEICVVANAGEASDIALVAGLSGGAVGRSSAVHACLRLRTIPVVRVDSVLVLLGVIAFVVLSIVAAIFCWKCSNREDASGGGGSGGAEDGKEEEEDGEGLESEIEQADKKPDLETQPLLDSEKPAHKNNQPAPEVGITAEPEEVQPVNAGLQSNDLPTDGQLDKPTPV